ncbi:Sugar phosphate isomerase/epimerase [Paenibacillus sophorae]|uniref:Sugar phosphate isomerase/epimerase n=1 Tax=Paenibacillus sophorae TaxID=1333845 RepID=A0A1H8HZA7_9BACL|nr:sugar phosphate isomerase/epimerase [Paenibacillus sophorae]QWU15805.1 sugar phosphate isomerase/epimerase [Paenibacillus sophorae]SEN61609.1 Sugar phosphate isomerase/epimerase [Paenibacillus sophorae]
MKLSISNIAWEADDEEQVIKVLQSRNATGIEIAPTKKWKSPVDCTEHELNNYRVQWIDRGLEPVAMQSLLFGQPDLILFGEENSRVQLIDYLTKIIRVAGVLGTKALVFGSPKNRLAGSLSSTERLDIAISFFYELGQVALENGVVFCIEPNPSQYGCDFVTDTDQGIELVKAVNHPGFRLHLDAAAMNLNGENYYESIEKSLPYLAHFHVSEPYLGLVGSNAMEHHQSIAKALKELHYKQYISIEMKSGLLPSNVESVRRAVDFVGETYL